MISGIKYYQWKVRDEADPQNLLTPWGDPMVYEYAFNLLFNSISAALDGLEDWGAASEAYEEGWVLVQTEINVVEGIKPRAPVEHS